MVTIEAEPVLATDLNGTVCSDEELGLSLAVATGSVSADSFNLVSVTAAAGLTAAGTNATAGGMIAADSLSGDAYENLTNAALTVAYVISPRTAGGCFGNEVTVTMTINPEPVLDASLDATVCSGESVSYTHLTLPTILLV